MKIALALLTCDRFDYTKRTCLSFLEQNNRADFELYWADDASTDERLVPFVESLGFECVLRNYRRRGCTPTSADLLCRVAERIGSEGLVLYLQNDFITLRPLNLAVVRQVFANPQIGVLRLYGRWKDAERTLPDVGGSQVVWTSLPIAEEKIEVAGPWIGKRGPWSFNPHISRASLLPNIVTGVRCETDAERISKQMKYRTARFRRNVTSHIGHQRTPGGEYGK